MGILCILVPTLRVGMHLRQFRRPHRQAQFGDLHLALDLLDEEQAEAILGYCEDHLEEE